MANRFEQEISKSHRTLGWYTIKVPVASRQGISFLNAAPFDFISIKSGIPYAVEAKMCKNNNTNFPLSRLACHQIDNLRAFAQAGGKAYIAISFRKPKLTAHLISIEDWGDICKELATVHKRKSIPRSWFSTDSRFIEIPRRKMDGGYIWDFSVIEPREANTRVRCEMQRALVGISKKH